MRIRALPLLGALIIAAVPVRASAAGPPSGEREQKAGAQQTFDAGSKLFDGKHFEEALVAFRASYQIVPSPNSRLMIARCLRELGHGAEAYREFDTVVREATAKGERYESAAHAATEEGEETKRSIALVTILVAAPPPGLVVKAGDAAIDVATLGTPFPMDPGTLTITADAPSFAHVEQVATLAAGTSPEITLTLTASPVNQPVAVAPPPSSPVPVKSSPSGVPRTWAYVAGGIGVAGLATFGIFGAMSNSKYSDLKSICPANHCGPGAQGDVDSGKQFQTIANVGLVLGVVGLGVGTTLFFLGHPGHAEGTASAGTVRVAAGPTSIVVDGVFE